MAHALLAKAVEAEAADFLERYSALKTADGRQRTVRTGHLPERAMMTGTCAAQVRQPCLRNREPDAGKPIVKFTPSILPPYAQSSKSLDALLSISYLKDVSTRDFGVALAALLGKDPPGLSASNIARPKDVWTDGIKAREKRDFSTKGCVYTWPDGIHLQARLEEDAQCILELIGATPEGKKELVGFTDGLRKSAQSWAG